MNSLVKLIDHDRWAEVWVTITRNKRRSLLTAFGVFWGVFMLIVMLGAGRGIGNGIRNNVEGVPTNSAFFWAENTTVPYKGFRKGRQWTFKSQDIDILLEHFQELEDALPIVFSSEAKTVNGELTGSYRFKGLAHTYKEYVPIDITNGRFLNKMDVDLRRKVCVIGRKVADEMFKKGQEIVGSHLTINGILFQVIGIVSQRSNMNINGSDDESIIAPYTVIQQINNYGDDIHMIGLRAKKGVVISRVLDDIRAFLMERHTIAPDDTTAIGNVNFEKIFNQFAMLFMAIELLVWIVGIGTLLSGVIGVSNIIMITVRERTREIGIRRAVGARPTSIISQIMSESLVLTAAAGLAGLCLGVAVMGAVSYFVGEESKIFQNPQIDFGTSLLAAGIIILLGLASGILPAWRAMQIKAIDAIREE